VEKSKSLAACIARCTISAGFYRDDTNEKNYTRCDKARSSYTSAALESDRVGWVAVATVVVENVMQATKLKAPSKTADSRFCAIHRSTQRSRHGVYKPSRVEAARRAFQAVAGETTETSWNQTDRQIMPRCASRGRRGERIPRMAGLPRSQGQRRGGRRHGQELGMTRALGLRCDDDGQWWWWWAVETGRKRLANGGWMTAFGNTEGADWHSGSTRHTTTRGDALGCESNPAGIGYNLHAPLRLISEPRPSLLEGRSCAEKTSGQLFSAQARLDPLLWACERSSAHGLPAAAACKNLNTSPPNHHPVILPRGIADDCDAVTPCLGGKVVFQLGWPCSRPPGLAVQQVHLSPLLP